MSQDLLVLLSKDYNSLLESSEFCDVTIQVGEDLNFKEFRVHSLILRARSPYFRIALSKEWARNRDNKMILEKPNISPGVFGILLKYIYCGVIDLVKYDTPIIIQLLSASDELCFLDLCEHIQEHLVTLGITTFKQHFAALYQFVIHNSHYKKLSELCNKIIELDSSAIFNSPDFKEVKPHCLLKLLKEGSSNLPTMKLWEKLIEWSIGQDASLPLDPSLWTDSNISTFGILVKPYLQYIEFRLIDPDVFFQKIRPFREIFDDNFYIQILEYHSFSKIKQCVFTKIDIDSTVISPRHAGLISGWIYGVDSVCKTNDHEFRLLCRGSRDGFTPKIFHKMCDGKGPTITVLKVQNTGEILGGYNPLSWKSPSSHKYYKTKESFLFSFSPFDITDFIISRVADENHATYHDSSFGPCFGDGDSDFQMFKKFNVDGRCRCIRTSYEKSIRHSEDYFSVDDYEVFQVVLPKN